MKNKLYITNYQKENRKHIFHPNKDFYRKVIGLGTACTVTGPYATDRKYIPFTMNKKARAMGNDAMRYAKSSLRAATTYLKRLA